MEGFSKIERGGQVALVRDAQAEAIAAALIDGTGCTAVPSGGRGDIHVFPVGEGEGILRPYRRGGLVARLLGDAYVLSIRPLQEFRIHHYLEGSGFPVPALLGVTWRRQGVFFRGAIATRRVNAQNLQERHHSAGGVPEGVLRDCGRLIRRLHDLGVWHADLQVRNILVGAEGPLLIDFDNARRSAALSATARARNLLRLRRSFEKNGLPDFGLVLEGYGETVIPGWLDAAYRWKGRLSDRMQRKKQL